MPLPRKRRRIPFSEEEMVKLENIGNSRIEEKRRTLRAACFLAVNEFFLFQPMDEMGSQDVK